MTTLETEQPPKKTSKCARAINIKHSDLKCINIKCSHFWKQFKKIWQPHVHEQASGVDGAHLQNVSPQIQHVYFHVFYQHMFAYTEQRGVLGVWMEALLLASGDLEHAGIGEPEDACVFMLW